MKSRVVQLYIDVSTWNMMSILELGRIQVKGGLLGLWLEYVVKVDEASEIKNKQICTVGAQTSRLVANDSWLMNNYRLSTNGVNRKWGHLSSRLYRRLMSRISQLISRISRLIIWISRLMTLLAVFFCDSDCSLSWTQVFFFSKVVVFVLLEFV